MISNEVICSHSCPSSFINDTGVAMVMQEVVKMKGRWQQRDLVKEDVEAKVEGAKVMKGGEHREVSLHSCPSLSMDNTEMVMVMEKVAVLVINDGGRWPVMGEAEIESRIFPFPRRVPQIHSKIIQVDDHHRCYKRRWASTTKLPSI